MDLTLRARLSAMMFLQYFAWGAWFVPFATYLTYNGLQDSVGTIYSSQGWAAIAAPLFVGAIADRYFAAEKVMGILHLATGGLLFLLSAIGADAGIMFLATLGVLLAFMPTIALSNTIALNGLTDPEKQFPALRVFGTIGWIAAGLTVGLVLPGEAERTAVPIYLAGAASIAYGLDSFTLPHTPPGAGRGKPSVVTLLGLDAIRDADRSFWTLIVCTTLMMVPFAFYNVYANPFLDDIGVNNPAAVQTIGQVSEIGFLLFLPLFFRWFAIKGVLFVGMAAWAIRYVIFAFGFTADGPINIRNARFAEDQAPLDPSCSCPVCATWSRAYLHHLVRAGEIVGAMLRTEHNISFYQQLMAGLRGAIEEGRLKPFADAFRARYRKLGEGG